MMDCSEIERRNLIEEYLRHRLDDSIQAEFEDHLLVCGHCLAEVEAEERLRLGLQGLQARDELPTETIPQAAARRNTQAGSLALAWAASILLALAPVVWLYQRGEHLEQRLMLDRQQATVDAQNTARQVRTLEQELDDARAALDAARRRLSEAQAAEARPPETGIAELRRRLSLVTSPTVGLPVLHLSAVRSTDQRPAHRLTLSNAPEWVVVIVEPAGTDARYDLRWLTPNGNPLLTRKGLEPDAYGALTLSVYSPDLKTGVHRIIVTGRDSANDVPGPSQTLQLDVSRPDAAR